MFPLCEILKNAGGRNRVSHVVVVSPHWGKTPLADVTVFQITLSNADCQSNRVVCSTYLDHLAEEVNDKLQEAGLISIAELCKNYDLPGDFLSEVSLRTTVLMPQLCSFFFLYA